MFDALTISCDIAVADHQPALDALRAAGLTAEIGHLEAEPVVIAVFPHDGTRPALTDWTPWNNRPARSWPTAASP